MAAATIISITSGPQAVSLRAEAEVISTQRLRLLYALEYTLLEQHAQVQQDIAKGARIDPGCPYRITGYKPAGRIVLDVTDPTPAA